MASGNPFKSEQKMTATDEKNYNDTRRILSDLRSLNTVLKVDLQRLEADSAYESQKRAWFDRLRKEASGK